MTDGVDTCPKCGALITRNLARCRQCKTYLHGTQTEGFLLEHLLPPQLAASPGTGIFFLIIALYYVLMVVLAGFDSALGFSSYSLVQLGGAWSPGLYQGQYWRFVTSAFAHGGIVHIGFNLYALTIVGPLIEQAFDRKKMMLVYLAAAVLSMAFSHYVNTSWLGQGQRMSVGASGGVSGLIGACFVAAKRLGPPAQPLATAMLRWTAYMALWGFMLGGIDNAAHAGGWLIGGGLAALVPLGATRTVAANRALSVVVLAALLGVAACVALMLDAARGYPMALENDAQGQRVLVFTVSEGVEWKHSDQYQALVRCEDAARAVSPGAPPTDEQIHACELAARCAPQPALYHVLADLYAQRGDADRARTLRSVAARLGGRR